MYQEHFGFLSAPFGLTPDTDFFFGQASHQSALNMLMVALRSGEGFLKVTGEIGLGKTTLCRMLLRELSGESASAWASAYLPHPSHSRTALITMVAEELGCEIDTNSKNEPELLLGQIQKQLLGNARAGKRTVLLVDEAQALNDEALEAVRLLTNLETEQDKLLQLVLFGQPELDHRLQQVQLRQLRQRISFSHELKPLNSAQFSNYVLHRVKIAGGSSLLFPPRVIDLLYGACRGVPRLGNILCHKALLSAFGPGRSEVSIRDALAAVEDTQGARISIRHWPLVMVREYPAMVALAVAAGIAIAILVPVLRS